MGFKGAILFLRKLVINKMCMLKDFVGDYILEKNHIDSEKSDFVS